MFAMIVLWHLASVSRLSRVVCVARVGSLVCTWVYLRCAGAIAAHLLDPDPRDRSPLLLLDQCRHFATLGRLLFIVLPSIVHINHRAVLCDCHMSPRASLPPGFGGVAEELELILADLRVVRACELVLLHTQEDDDAEVGQSAC